MMHDRDGRKPPQERQFCDGCAHTLMTLGEAITLMGEDPAETGLADAVLAMQVTLHMAMKMAVEQTNPGGQDPRGTST
jgi:hypothetical protein